MRAGARLGVVLHAKTGSSRWRKPSIVPSFRLRCVSSSSGRSNGVGSTAKPWFCEVISTWPVRQVLHRLVGAAVAELQLEGLAAAGQAQDLVAQADAEDRHLFP